MNYLDTLTEREMEVLGLLPLGQSNKTIARTLEISENTVEQHLRNIYKKLDVNNRTTAAVMYVYESIGSEAIHSPYPDIIRSIVSRESPVA